MSQPNVNIIKQMPLMGHLLYVGVHSQFLCFGSVAAAVVCALDRMSVTPVSCFGRFVIFVKQPLFLLGNGHMAVVEFYGIVGFAQR